MLLSDVPNLLYVLGIPAVGLLLIVVGGIVTFSLWQRTGEGRLHHAEAAPTHGGGRGADAGARGAGDPAARATEPADAGVETAVRKPRVARRR